MENISTIVDTVSEDLLPGDLCVVIFTAMIS